MNEYDGEMLNRIGIFADLDPMQIARVANITHAENYQPGQSIFKENDLAEDMYIVAEGAVVFGHNLDTPGEEEKIGRMTAGEAFGELSLFDGLPRSMDAKAEVETRLLRISKASWDGLIHGDTELGVHILENLAKTISFRLRKTNWDFELLRGRVQN